MKARARGHRTLAEKAFETLHQAIITGQLRPGTRLPIEELAEVLEMSPMPIREAVRRLDGAGLVENIPHRGARVTELSITDLAEVYEARLALEVLAIRRAAERFDGPHEAIAAARLDNLQGMSDDNSARTSAAHEAFHFSLYEAAASAWLTRLIRPVWETSERYCLETPQCRQTRHPRQRAPRDPGCVRRARLRPGRAGSARPSRADGQQHLGCDGWRAVVRARRPAGRPNGEVQPV